MKNYKKVSLVIFVLIIISIPLSTFLGSADLGFREVIEVYKYHFFSVTLEDMSLNSIVWNVRLPRILVAIAVGGGLAMTGSIMQAITGNIMAEPYTLGIQSGAGMFAAFSIAFWGKIPILSTLSTNLMAFIGAMFSMVIVYFIASKERGYSNSKLVLTGISISMLCSAITQLIISFAPDNSKVRGIVFWMMGGLGGVHWEDVPFAVIAVIIGFIVAIILAEQLNIISMGKETAVILGVKVKRLDKILLITVSMVVGVLVSISGSIGFVGLIIPHITRKITGANHKALLPVTSLLGAFFLLWADTVSRVIFAPRELAIGVLTSLVGVPFFLYIMKKEIR